MKSSSSNEKKSQDQGCLFEGFEAKRGCVCKVARNGGKINL